VRPARTADNSAVLVVPHVKVRMEVQHSIPPLKLHDVLQEMTKNYFTSYSECPGIKSRSRNGYRVSWFSSIPPIKYQNSMMPHVSQ
jgi:hypothetical protein